MVVANTVGIIAGRLGQPVHVIQYLVKTRKIEPALRAGNAWIFDDLAVAKIERELEIMKNRRVAQTA